jgi:hypothetical protein
VRRMFEAVGHPVSRLKRVRIGPIKDDHIRPGEFRDLDEREISALKREAARTPYSPPRIPADEASPRPADRTRTSRDPRSRARRPNDRPRRG